MVHAWCTSGATSTICIVDALTKLCPGNYTKSSLYSKLKLSSAVNRRSIVLGSLCISEIEHTMVESPCFLGFKRTF